MLIYDRRSFKRHSFKTISLNVLFSFLLLSCLSITASARNMDDVSQRRIIGFSPNGDYFAFEEFGKNPGTGTAYANIYVINTVRNQWVKGSPFRIKPARGLRSTHRARKLVQRKANRMLKRFGIQRKRVRILASNPITELGKNKMRVVVNPRVSISEVAHPMVFSIAQFPMRKPRHCRHVRKRIMGLEIRLKREGERRKVVHRDKKIPISRGCPISYQISDVIQLKKASDQGAVYAVIYSIIRQGRYGLERRFIGGGYHDKGDRRDPNYYDDDNDYSDYDTPYEYQTSNAEDDIYTGPTRTTGYYQGDDRTNTSSPSNEDRYNDDDDYGNTSSDWLSDDPSDRNTGYNYKKKNSKPQRRR